MSNKLFSPYTLKGVTLKNRIAMAPMCMYSSDEEGYVNDWHYTHYISRAIGQVGLIIMEATAVTKQGRISNRDLGIWNDAQIEPLQKLTRLMKKHGAATGIQLGHAGRKATVDGDIIAPSPISFNNQYKIPIEMSINMISETIEAFKASAARAKEAGFDVIEIHAAHGYLINQFLSPLTNHRTDKYGGSFDNRYRLLKEIIESVRTVWHGPLFVRVSATEYDKNGLTLTDHLKISQKMKEQEVDLIDVSSGGNVPTSPPNVFPGYQVPLAETIKKEVEIKTAAVGLITSPLHAEEILQNNRTDLILLGRVLLREPYWAKNAADELNVSIEVPGPYERGWI